MAELTTGKVIALIRALSTSSTSSATYTVTDALILGAATTSGVRLEVNSGYLEVREGDDSAGGDLVVRSLGVGTAPSASAGYINCTQLQASTGMIVGFTEVRGGSGSQFGWSSNATASAANRDTSLARASAGVVAVLESTNNSSTNIHQITASSGALSGASYSFSNALPAGAIILGVTVRVTTTITGATSFSIGDGTDVDRYGATIALASGTTTTFASATASPLEWRSAVGNVVLTANGSNFTGGVVRLCVHYLTGTAPTS